MLLSGTCTHAFHYYQEVDYTSALPTKAHENTTTSLRREVALAC